MKNNIDKIKIQILHDAGYNPKGIEQSDLNNLLNALDIYAEFVTNNIPNNNYSKTLALLNQINSKLDNLKHNINPTKSPPPYITSHTPAYNSTATLINTPH